MTLNMSIYAENKAKGNLTLQNIGPKQFQLLTKKFDQDTGAQLQTEIVNIDREGAERALKAFEEAKAQQEKAIANVKQLLADMDAIDVKA